MSSADQESFDICDDLLEDIWFTPLYIGSFFSVFVVGSILVTNWLQKASPIFKGLAQHKQRDTIIYLLNSVYYICAVIPFSITAFHVLTTPLREWDDGRVKMGGRVVCLGMFVYILDMVYRGQPPRITLILHHVTSFAIFSSAVDPTFCRDISTDQEMQSYTFRIRLLFLRCVVISSEFPIFLLLALHKLHNNPKYVFYMAKINVLTYPVLQMGGHVGHVILMIQNWNVLETGWIIWYALVLFVIMLSNWPTQAILISFAKKFADPEMRRDPTSNAWISSRLQSETEVQSETEESDMQDGENGESLRKSHSNEEITI